MRDNKPFSQLGYMSDKMHSLAESQDKIGWRHFTKGYISIHFYNIQRFHLSMSGRYLNGSDWTKQFISKNSSTDTFTMDLSKHIPPRQETGIPTTPTIKGLPARNHKPLRTQPR